MTVCGRRSGPWVVILAAALLGTLWAPNGGARAGSGVTNPCLLHAREAEQRAAVPAGLLSAMAHVESGRWRPELRARRPWPWTLRAGSRFWYLPSRDAALDTLRTLKAEGVESIDVGCMQINLRYHPAAFATLEDALDPAANVAYAAAFLRDLKDETGSWRRAAGYYHSRKPDRWKAYLATVEREWQRSPAPAEKPQGPLTAAAVSELRALCDQVMASLGRLRRALQGSTTGPTTTAAHETLGDPTSAAASRLVLNQ